MIDADGLILDPRAFLADWRTAPETLPDRVLIAKGSGIRIGEICRLAGVDRRTVRQLLRQAQ